MKARTLTRALGVILSAALVIASRFLHIAPTIAGMSTMTTPIGGMSITSTALAGLGIMTTPTAAIEPLGMPGRPTTVAAPMTTATGILPELSGTGGRMHGIMHVVTIITIGSNASKRKENMYA